MTANQAPPQHSPDGRWWWDGQKWIPVPQPSPSAPTSHPEEEPEIRRSQSHAKPRRAPVKLGGTADRRFERRFALFRRVARYLLLADVLALVVVGTYNGVSRSGTVDLVFNVLYYALPFLVVLSLLGIIDRHASSEVNISANPERVFALLVDPDAWVRHGGTWLGRYRSIERTETAASGGTKGRALTVSLGLPGEVQWEMLEYEPPGASLRWLAQNGSAWCLESASPATHFSRRVVGSTSAASWRPTISGSFYSDHWAVGRWLN
jgi:uncharacterized protein YndB with AHSA1/START domain